MHQAKVIDKKKLSDGAVAVLLQCCNDPSTQSWHTLHITKEITTDDVQAWLATAQQHVQDSHATAQAVDAHLDSIIAGA